MTARSAAVSSERAGMGLGPGDGAMGNGNRNGNGNGNGFCGLWEFDLFSLFNLSFSLLAFFVSFSWFLFVLLGFSFLFFFLHWAMDGLHFLSTWGYLRFH